jgi:putative hemolysin
MSRVEIKITRDPGEIREAQRLRFEVFNLEMKKGLPASYARRLDVDEFDSVCDHLIVRDLKSKEIVGTYRLLLGSRARATIGFYSEHEFNLERVKRLDGELLELGRTCARRDFRSKALIPLMWGTIAAYVRERGVRYIFGCGSLYTTERSEAAAHFAMLRKKFYAPQEYRVFPVPEKAFPHLSPETETVAKPAPFQRLPSLLKGYLRAGAWVCGPPALDNEFGTTDFFMLLDFHRLGGSYINRLGLAEVRA